MGREGRQGVLLGSAAQPLSACRSEGPREQKGEGTAGRGSFKARRVVCVGAGGGGDGGMRNIKISGGSGRRAGSLRCCARSMPSIWDQVTPMLLHYPVPCTAKTLLTRLELRLAAAPTSSAREARNLPCKTQYTQANADLHTCSHPAFTAHTCRHLPIGPNGGVAMCEAHHTPANTAPHPHTPYTPPSPHPTQLLASSSSARDAGASHATNLYRAPHRPPPPPPINPHTHTTHLPAHPPTSCHLLISPRGRRLARHALHLARHARFALVAHARACIACIGASPKGHLGACGVGVGRVQVGAGGCRRGMQSAGCAGRARAACVGSPAKGHLGACGAGLWWWGVRVRACVRACVCGDE